MLVNQAQNAARDRRARRRGAGTPTRASSRTRPSPRPMARSRSASAASGNGRGSGRRSGCRRLATEARFATNGDRVEHRDELIPILADRFATEHQRDVARRASTRPGSPPARSSTCPRRSPRPRPTALGMRVPLEHPALGRVDQVGLPFELPGTPASIRTAAAHSSASTPTRSSPRPATRPLDDRRGYGPPGSSDGRLGVRPAEAPARRAQRDDDDPGATPQIVRAASRSGPIPSSGTARAISARPGREPRVGRRHASSRATARRARDADRRRAERRARRTDPRNVIDAVAPAPPAQSSSATWTQASADLRRRSSSVEYRQHASTPSPIASPRTIARRDELRRR